MKRSIGMMVAVLAFATNVASARPHSKSTPEPSPSATTSASPSPDAEVTATPVAAPSASPVPTHVPVLPIDGAYSLPGGIWKCETLANTTATSVYHLVGRGHIEEKTTLHLPKRPPVELDTTFEFLPRRKAWVLIMQKGAYIATAPVWSSGNWIFKGIESDAEPHRVVRLVYTSLGADAYRSDYEAKNNSGWETFSGATCKREIP